jgi:hypothetical protein
VEPWGSRLWSKEQRYAALGLTLEFDKEARRGRDKAYNHERIRLVTLHVLLNLIVSFKV